MNLVLDAGAFVALEAGDELLAARLRRERVAGRSPVTHGGVIGQVWRGGHRRQAGLARALGYVEVVPLDDTLGRRAGLLLGQAGAADVVDAALVLLAYDGDRIITSDPVDLGRLAEAADKDIEIFRV